MSFLRLLSWPLRYEGVLPGVSAGVLEMELCVCCSFLEVAQSISSCCGVETDLKSVQNRGSGTRVSALLLAGGGEITCSHLGALLGRISSEHLFA